jgi:hypothetical protein
MNFICVGLQLIDSQLNFPGIFGGIKGYGFALEQEMEVVRTAGHAFA